MSQAAASTRDQTNYGGPMGEGPFLGRRASRRVFATVATIGSFGWLGACGQSDEPTSIDSVQKCLEDEGLEVLAAMPGPDDDDAPDRGELVTSGALVAFYSSSDRAEQLAAGIRKNAEQTRGEVARYDDVTVLYLPKAKRDTIENCVEP
jgi:hypothetical protein